MASTYTETGLELIGVGEQSNTWGETTNTNWRLAEELATGVVSISLNGLTSYSLTATTGATSNGRHFVVEFTGSPGATSTVTVSPADMQKVYILNNATDQTVNITQGSGGSVAVPAGTKKIVYCDGAGSGASVTDVTQNLSLSGTVNIDTFKIDGVSVLATANEINTLDGLTASTAELNLLDGVTATTAEINVLDGLNASTADLNLLNNATVTTAEINTLGGVTGGIQNQLDGLDSSKAEKSTTINSGGGLIGGGNLHTTRTISHADTSSQGNVNNSGRTVVQDVYLDGYGHVTNINSKSLSLSDFGVSASASELNKTDGLTASTAEINTLDGATATTTEINTLSGVTSGVQGQLNDKAEKNTSINSGGGLSGGGSLASNRTISHANTSSQGNVNNSGRTVVQDVYLDGYGHATNINSKTLNLSDFGVSASASELNKTNGLTASTAELNTAANHYVPSGGIIMWSGSTGSVPSGWRLCDGSGGTPDLRNRFVVGAGGAYSPNNTGGSSSVTLTENEMPSHDHGMSTNGDHNHSETSSADMVGTFDINGFDSGQDLIGNPFGRFSTASEISSGISVQKSGTNATSRRVKYDATHTHAIPVDGSHSHNIYNTGGGNSHENRPPYYALAYIMKT